MASLGCIMAVGVKLLLPPLKDFAASKIQKWWRARNDKIEGVKLLAQLKINKIIRDKAEEIMRKTKEVGASKIQKWWRTRNDKIEGVKLLAQHKINKIIRDKAEEIKHKIAENLNSKAKRYVRWGVRKGAGKCVRWFICAVI
jgi:very-short-patch-repair endonuclease